MKTDTSKFFDSPECELAAEVVLDGSWRSLPDGDPVSQHITACASCRKRVAEVALWQGYFSAGASDSAQPPIARRSTADAKRSFELLAPRREWIPAAWSLVSRAAILVVTAGLVGWGILTYRNQDAIGSVGVVEGEVVRDSGGSGSLDRVAEGDSIFLGDIIHTQAGGRALITTEEINRIAVGENTTVKFESRRELQQRSGTLWADVQKGHGEFEIETRGADVAVIGTRFGVEYDQEVVRVGVTEGRVQVYTKGGSVQLAPGETAEYRYDIPFLPPKHHPQSMVQAPAWAEMLLNGGKP